MTCGEIWQGSCQGKRSYSKLTCSLKASKLWARRTQMCVAAVGWGVMVGGPNVAPYGPSSRCSLSTLHSYCTSHHIPQLQINLNQLLDLCLKRLLGWRHWKATWLSGPIACTIREVSESLCIARLCCYLLAHRFPLTHSLWSKPLSDIGSLD